ncbi:hypothetical protein Q3G72_007967 [Acer saccharum]|nr:hypothetical protein Q3G72_007967 [Acer saccharum]
MEIAVAVAVAGFNLKPSEFQPVGISRSYSSLSQSRSCSRSIFSSLLSFAFCGSTPMAQSRLKKVSSVDSNSVIQNQHLNGGSFGMAGGLSNVKILSKSRDPFQLNGSNFERSSATNTQSKGPTQGKPNTNLVGKQQGRSTGAALTSRRYFTTSRLQGKVHCWRFTAGTLNVFSRALRLLDEMIY